MATGYVYKRYPLKSHPENSSNKIILQVPFSRFKSCVDCTFSFAVPICEIRNVSSRERFKSILKSQLFKVAFIDK